MKVSGHAVDAPVDAGAPVRVEADLGVGVALGAQEAAHVLGRVLLRDAIDRDAFGFERGIGGERHQVLVLEMAGLAPGAEHVDHADMALRAGRRRSGPRAPSRPGSVSGGAGWPISAEGMREGSPAPSRRNNSAARASEGDERQEGEPASRTRGGFGVRAHRRRASFAPRRAASSARVASSKCAVKRR